ncbi:MAG: HEAT repeat domain-containing protein [Planctomycetes bacterium]|nr:HEAT repeat domain-containing protein [Planctomycetota bacterium]MCB9918339.1 HEAT repeat domain-containing protein [Planctomycetota bacterium]
MVHGFGRSLLVFSTSLLFSATSLLAQDAKEAFQEGVRLLRLNQNEEALVKFREAVSANPSNEEAYQLWKDTQSRVWAAMMEKDEFANIATHFLRLAQLERQRMSADADAIQALVKKSLSADYNERSAANAELMSKHGEYAVPFLVDALGNADNDAEQSYAILALDRIGRAATLPLLAVLQSESALLRRNAAAALLYIEDTRALPALLALAANDEDAAVREVAARAVAKLGGSADASAVDTYLSQCEGYLTGKNSQLRDGDIRPVLWSWQEGKLVPRDVPAAIFPYELSKDFAYRALDVDPQSEAAVVALTRAYSAIKAVVASADGDEALAGVAAKLPQIDDAMFAAGPAVVRAAYAANVSDGLVPAAKEALDVLAKVEDPSDLQGSPLLESLESNDKRLRYGAAIALSSMGAKLEPQKRQEVIAALGDAVREQSRRIVQVIDSSDAADGIARNASSGAKGLVVEASKSALTELPMLTRFPPDVLVLEEKLENLLVDDVLRWMAKRPERFANTKVVLITKDKAAAEQTWGDKINGYIEGGLSVEGLRAAVDTVLDGVPLRNDEADQVAAKAADAISKLDPKVYPVADASAQLIEAAGLKEAVAVASLEALANAGGAQQLAGIVSILEARKSEPSVCKAACDALGHIMSRAGIADQAAIDALSAIAKGEDQACKTAAITALGRAPILPGLRAKLMRDLRVDPGAGADQ